MPLHDRDARPDTPPPGRLNLAQSAYPNTLFCKDLSAFEPQSDCELNFY